MASRTWSVVSQLCEDRATVARMFLQALQKMLYMSPILGAYTECARLSLGRGKGRFAGQRGVVVWTPCTLSPAS